MPKVNVLVVSKAQLQTLSKNELGIVLCGGKILDEINVFTKLTNYAYNAVRDTTGTIGTTEGFVERIGGFTYLMTLLRATAGQLFEAHQYLKNEVRIKEYPQEWLDDEFRAKWKEMNKYFDRQNILHWIRNRIGFHTDFNFMKMALDQQPDQFQFTILHGESRGDSVYMGSTELIMGAMSPDAQGNVIKSIETANNETVDVAQIITHLLSHLLVPILSRRLKIPYGAHNRIVFEDGPIYTSVRLPFFCRF